MTEPLKHHELFNMTVTIASSYLSNESAKLQDIGPLIKTIYKTLYILERAPDPSSLKTNRNPAVPIEDSITDDHIVCLEDGKKLKMLKRHVNSVYNMTIDGYKERWGLPSDYPSVAPSYTKHRSQIAKNTGLGLNNPLRRKGKKKMG